MLKLHTVNLNLNKLYKYILDLKGSDRHDIHLHLERPPVVRDLMEELEKKSRVTVPNQQLIFRGNENFLLQYYQIIIR